MVRDGDYDKLVFIQAVKELTDNVKSIVDDEDDESDARVVQNAFSLGLEEFGVWSRFFFFFFFFFVCVCVCVLWIPLPLVLLYPLPPSPFNHT